ILVDFLFIFIIIVMMIKKIKAFLTLEFILVIGVIFAILGVMVPKIVHISTVSKIYIEYVSNIDKKEKDLKFFNSIEVDKFELKEQYLKYKEEVAEKIKNFNQ
ncbi:MAG: hypothetical protein ACK5XN_23920, partial [Bacteroidota bacterium]